MAAPRRCVPRCAKNAVPFAARHVGTRGASPAPARLLGAAVRWEIAEQSCRVAVVREVHERHFRALVRLQRARERELAGNLVGYRALAVRI